jgi:mono/diheme cytochrome c family protein
VLTDEARQGLAIAPVQLTFDPADAERVGRGSYLVNAAGSCGDCHTLPPDGAHLAGGQAFPLGEGASAPVVYARNLTPDPTTGLRRTEDEFIATLRTGVDHDSPGDRLLVMPWHVHRYMTMVDLQSIYAYLQAIPAAMNDVPSDVSRPSLPPVAYDSTNFNTDDPLPDETRPDADHVLRGVAISPVPVTDAAEAAGNLLQVGRGSYLVNAVAACNDCHTFNAQAAAGTPPGVANVVTMTVDAAHFLGGGRIFDIPGLPAIVQSPDIAAFGDGLLDFLRVIESGQHGADEGFRPVLPPMPWPALGQLTADDLAAIHAYLTVLPPQPDVTRSPTFRCDPSAATDTCSGGTSCVGSVCQGQSCSSTDECPVLQACNSGSCTYSP